MNADRLLAHFERVADAPDAIPRLRRLILDIAVRGKLVEQEPNDEPVGELLKRIAAEKARLVKGKKMSKQVPFQPPDPSKISFDLPSSWSWCLATYPSYIISDKGKKIKTKDVSETGKFPVVDQGKMLIRGYHNDANKVIRVKEPIVLFGDHTRETKLIDFDFIVGADGVKLLQPIFVFASYYFLALRWLPLDNRGYGRHFKLLKASFIPLPPIAEQHRIVAKVDELMALCDELEAAQAEREATRDRLAAASLARLSEPDLETFHDDARFALDALPDLTKRPDQIQQLRQTILNLAVRGKLVDQDPNDEPAEELLKQIAAEKARLVKEGKIKKTKIPHSIEHISFLFEVPPGWEWSRLLDISRKIHYGYTASANSRIDDVRLLRITDIQNDRVEWRSVPGCEIEEKVLPNFKLETGDILVARTGGTIGKSFLVTELPVVAVFASYLIRVQVSREIYDRYLKFLFESSIYWEQLQEGSRGAGQPNVNGQTLGKMLFPLPPLAEQHRIVAKVDELMGLCDQLEASLTNGEETRSRLLDALLAETIGA